jgi:hypothetical protein
VYPYDTSGDASESRASEVPFFQTTFKTVPLMPSIPMSTGLYRALGIDTTLVMPPLPQGQPEEIVGTDRWASSSPSMFTWKSHIGWFDMRQGGEDGAQVGEHENFWPGMKRWVLGVRMDDVAFTFSEGVYWAPPGEEPLS